MAGEGNNPDINLRFPFEHIKCTHTHANTYMHTHTDTQHKRDRNWGVRAKFERVPRESLSEVTSECRLRGNNCCADVSTAVTGAQFSCLRDKKKGVWNKMACFKLPQKCLGQWTGTGQYPGLESVTRDTDTTILDCLTSTLLLSLTKARFLKSHNSHGQGSKEGPEGAGAGEGVVRVLLAHSGLRGYEE